MEKQTLTAIKSIYKFNQECKRPDGSCLLDQGYDDLKEIAFSIEEMIEATDGTGINLIASALSKYTPEIRPTPKDVSRSIAWLCYGGTAQEASDVDRLDKHLDSIVYNFGSIFKLGLTPQQALKALSIVCEANLQKLSAGQDEHGKQRKPEDFVPPETRLQAILDERI